VIRKFENIVFLAFIFLIPLQTRVFLFTPDRFESEWLSGFLYATDIIVAALFVLWALRVRRDGLSIRVNTVVMLVLTFVAVSFLTVLWAQDVPVAVYRSIKLAEYVWVFFYAVQAIPRISLRSVSLAFIGESFLAPITPGVAEIMSPTTRFIRAYGTFSSPNVLAAYLGFVILLLLWWYVQERAVSSGKRAGVVTALFVLVLAFVLTFSRTAFVAYGVALLGWFGVVLLLKGPWQRRVREVALIAVAVHVVIGLIFLPELYARFFESGGLAQNAIVDRLLYNVIAADLFVEQPWGVGAGNFTRVFGLLYQSLPGYLYQPVHNIFLLTAVELGVAGVVVFVFFIARLVGRVARAAHEHPGTRVIAVTMFAGVVMFIIEGTADHFFMTIQQGALLLWVFLAMVYDAGRRHD
jgi:O-antigen ligase